tara:strand:+ start:2314 stop:2589 length:276 start_codon:yes stop_codon:yes gene_type:complete
MTFEQKNRDHMRRIKGKTLDFMSRSIVEYQNDTQPVSDPLAVTTTLAAMQACLVEAYSEHLGEGEAASFFYGIADDLAVRAPARTKFKKFK